MPEKPLLERDSPVPWTSPQEGLPLRHATPDPWSAAALLDLDALLRDHAHCEKKAASAGLTAIGKCPDDEPLVRAMLALAHEEIRHFRQVHELILRRGCKLGPPQPDRYVRELRRRGFQHKGGLGPVVDLLLLNGLIEARSCERLRLLAEGLRRGEGALSPGDREELSTFYRQLAAAEARHWETFRDLANRFAPQEQVELRLDQLAQVEAEIAQALPFEPRMH
jgi:tRNA-(ms[2]io[6]A)-hydroxylase